MAEQGMKVLGLGFNFVFIGHYRNPRKRGDVGDRFGCK